MQYMCKCLTLIEENGRDGKAQDISEGKGKHRTSRKGREGKVKGGERRGSKLKL